jgi:hypothetical protein
MKKEEASRYNIYFIIRSAIAGLMGFLIFSFLAWLLKTLTYVQAIIISFIAFASPVVLSKVFHEKIESLVEKIFIFLERHKKIKRFVLKIVK